MGEDKKMIQHYARMYGLVAIFLDISTGVILNGGW